MSSSWTSTSCRVRVAFSAATRRATPARSQRGARVSLLSSWLSPAGMRTCDLRAGGCAADKLVVRASKSHASEPVISQRRAFLSQAASAAVALALMDQAAPAAVAVGIESPLCDGACVGALDQLKMVTTPSGLRYKDLVVGKGPLPTKGVQLVADFVAMVPQKDGSYFIFEDTVSKGKPSDIRVTGDPETASVIAGLDEGLITMRVGGIRRLYIPGNLAFPKGLASAPGRPRVAPASDVVFDVNLRYIPGADLDADDDEDYVLEI